MFLMQFCGNYVAIMCELKFMLGSLIIHFKYDVKVSTFWIQNLYSEGQYPVEATVQIRPQFHVHVNGLCDMIFHPSPR